MSVLGTAGRARLVRPFAALTALTFGIGLASPAFGMDDDVEPLEQTTISAPADSDATPEPEADGAADLGDDADPPGPDQQAGPSSGATDLGVDGGALQDTADLQAEAASADGNETDDPANTDVSMFAAEDEVTIDILSINDFHGRIEADNQSAGGAVLACAVDRVREDNPNALFVSAGDNIGASTFTSFITEDVPTIEVLNEIGLDVSAFGNHEFDRGQDDVNSRLVGPDRMTEFDYIAANIYRDGERAYEPYVIREVDGVRVGFIGALTPEMESLVTPTGITGLEFRKPLDDVNEIAAQLTDGDAGNDEADVLVVLVHDGAANPDLASADGTAFGELVAGASDDITAIISGHTHEAYINNVGGMWVTQTGQYGENLGHLSVTYDTATGEVTASDAVNVDLVVGDEPLCGGDADVQAIVDAATAKADELGSKPLGEITADLMRARQSNGAENRGGESTLGNAVADVQLWAAQRTNPDAQIAFMNPGGLRDDMTYAPSGTEGAGVVTYKEAAVVQPFANTLVTTRLTGAQVVAVLEEQWQPADAGRPFLKLGVSAGLTYLYDPAAEDGAHIMGAFLDGEELDPDAMYTVAMNSFLAAGGDNFATLAQGSGTADSGQSDLAAMVDYLEEFAVLAPDYAQRAVGVTWVSDPDAVYEAGDEIAVDVSSFAFSAGEPVPDELETALGGLGSGAFALDPGIVDTTDEVGRAQIRVMVPDDLAVEGDPNAAGLVEAVLALEIVDPVNETAVALPVAVALAPQEVAPPTDEPTGEPTQEPTGVPGGGAGAGPSGSLPRTGSDVLGLVLGSLLLVTLGSAGAFLAARSRKVD